LLDPTGHYVAAHTPGGPDGIEPEKAIPEMNRKAAEDQLHARGFGWNAIKYYGVDVLSVALASNKLSTAVQLAADKYAAQQLAIWRQFAKADHESDPLYRMFEPPPVPWTQSSTGRKPSICSRSATVLSRLCWAAVK
jgi:hypothetical protein